MFGRDPIKLAPQYRQIHEVYCGFPGCPSTEIHTRRGSQVPSYGETCPWCQNNMLVRTFVDVADSQAAVRNAKVETDRHLKEIRRAVSRLGLDEEKTLDQAVAHALEQIDTWRMEAAEANEIASELADGATRSLTPLTWPG